MAYKKATANRTNNTSLAKQAKIELSVASPDGDYLCTSNKVYSEKVSMVQEVDTTDSFISISSFNKTIGALTVHTAKAIIIKNIGITALEILMKTVDWREDSGGTDTDVVNSVDMNEENSTGEETIYRFQSMLLPVGEYMYLPSSRIINYSPLVGETTEESAANADAGGIAIEPKDIASAAEIIPIHLFSGTAYGSGADLQVTEDMAIDATTIAVDDGDWFEVGDLIAIGTEIMEVLSISTNTLTVKRGLLGSVQATHSDDDDLNFFIGNEHLAFDNGKCMTDQNGNFSQRGAFFYYGRTADKKIKGVVPGSVAFLMGYTEGGYLDWGLQNIKASDETGLAASTTYTFHIVVDEYNVGGIDSVSTETAIAFTTDASDTTWAGSSNAVLPKIQAVFDTQFYTTSSGLANKKVTIGLHNGDVRVQSHSNHSDTRVGIANVSGTSPFDVGRFPALSSSVPDLLGSIHGTTTDAICFGPASSLPQETIDDTATGKTIQNTDAFILDDGNGNLTHNGSIVGSIDYAKGHCNFTSHLPNAEFKIYAETLSAHSGGITYLANAFNSLQEIKARTVNAKQNGKVELLLLG